MRIGLITGEYPPMQGGVGDFTRELARELAVSAHGVHVITGRANGRAPDDVPAVAVHRAVDSWGLRCWRQIATITRRLDLQVLNIQYEPAAYGMRVGINFLASGYARRLVRQPIVTTFHDLLMPYLFPKAGPLRWQVVEYLARRSDAVIVTNAEDQAKLRAYKLRRDPVLIPIGSNIDPALAGEFDRAAERARWGAAPDELLVGYFGFLNLSKGGEVLMQAVKLLRDQSRPVRLLLIGGRTGASDPTNAAYASQVDDLIAVLNLKAHVTATGYLPSPEVSRALLACDVIALPYVDGASLRRGSLMAALAHGRPIVTTEPRYPIDGLTHARSAWFVPHNDPAALANALAQVLANADLRQQLARGASEAARRYTWDQIAAQTLDVYQLVASQA